MRKMMKKKGILFIYFLGFFCISCEMEDAIVLSSESLHEVYAKLIDNMEFPPNTRRIYIDTTINTSFQANDRLPLLDFYEKKINFFEFDTILDIGILKKAITNGLDSSEIIITDDSILKLERSDWNNKLQSENAVIIRFSRLFKNEYSNDYFVNISFICGRLCGNELFLQFQTNGKGDILSMNLRRSVS
jgi:hypothetical protein